MKCREHPWGVRRGQRSIILFVSFQRTNSKLGSRKHFRWKQQGHHHPPRGTPTIRWDCDGCCSVVCVVCSVLQNNCHYTCLVLKQLSERLASVLTALCPCLMEKEEQKNVLETLSWSFNFHGRDESMCDVTNSEDRFMLSLFGCFFYLIFYFLLNNRNPTWVTVIYLSNCLQ